MGQLDDKTALVTGASSGIGLAIARRFAAEGATVYLTGRRKAELDAAVAQVGARGIAIQGDASDLGDLDRLFAEIANRSGRLDIVVANAGVGDYGPLGTITEEEYDRTTSINLKGTVFTVQKALPLLTVGASVMLLSSSAALRAAPGLGVYAATKAAIRSLARTWAAELAGRGIRSPPVLSRPRAGTSSVPLSRTTIGPPRPSQPHRPRSAAPAVPTRSPPPPSTWPATKALSPPARNCSSTAAPHSSRRRIGDPGRIRRSRASEPRTCDRPEFKSTGTATTAYRPRIAAIHPGRVQRQAVPTHVASSFSRRSSSATRSACAARPSGVLMRLVS